MNFRDFFSLFALRLCRDCSLRLASGGAGTRPRRTMEDMRSRTAAAPFSGMARKPLEAASASGTSMASSANRVLPSFRVFGTTPCVRSRRLRFWRISSRYFFRAASHSSRSFISFSIAPTSPTDFSNFFWAFFCACLKSRSLRFFSLLRCACDFSHTPFLPPAFACFPQVASSPSSAPVVVRQTKFRYAATFSSSLILLTASAPSTSRSSCVMGRIFRSAASASRSCSKCLAAAIQARSS
mmetsp:Transcript_79819/g.230718  ORF Transcript_79819/g.230718 Transcript_79819/m.230718 type:complete len:240 (+) Transcript_79819:260-979(+)